MTGNKTRVRFAIIMAALLTVSLATPAAVGTTAAQSDGDDGLFTQLFDVLPDLPSVARGMMERFNPLAEQAEKADAKTYAKNTKTVLNENNQTLINWTNQRANVTEDWDVLRVKFTDSDGDSEYLFIVSDVNATTENITSGSAMNLTEFKATDRTVDKTYRLGPKTSRNAADELETFVTDYAEPNEDVDGKYLGRLAGKYAGDIKGPGIPTGWGIIGGDD